MKPGKAREAPRAEPRRLGGRRGPDGHWDWADGGARRTEPFHISLAARIPKICVVTEKRRFSHQDRNSRLKLLPKQARGSSYASCCAFEYFKVTSTVGSFRMRLLVLNGL